VEEEELLSQDLLKRFSLLIVPLILELSFPGHMLRLWSGEAPSKSSGQAFAASFDDAAKEGQNLGHQGIEGFKPENLDQTLNQKGLDPASKLVPRIDQATPQQKSYTDYYGNPNAISEGGSSDASQFVSDSYTKRPKFDLSKDPTFGNTCLQKDSQGKCVAWSGSKDLVTSAYPNCQKVVIPEYEFPPYRVTCTGTNTLVPTPTCVLRSFISFQTGTVNIPCQSFYPGTATGQIYAVCKDYYDWYRVLTTENASWDNTPIYFTEVGSEADLPPGVTYMFNRRTPDGARFKWYVRYRHSLLERMILTQDNTCGSNFDQWSNDCSVQKLEQCDLSGTQCTTVVENGQVIDQPPAPPLLKVSQGQTTAADCTPCSSTWDDGLGYEVWTCLDQCSGSCPPSAVLMSSLPPFSVQIGTQIIQDSYNCFVPTRTYETFLYYQNQGACENFSGSLESYSLCQKNGDLDLDNGSEVMTLSKDAAREDFSCTEFGVTVTMFRLWGGSEVKDMSGWFSKIIFACEQETSDCQTYIDQGCVEYSEECLNSDCSQVKYTYNCGGTGQVKSYKVVYNCLGDLRCMGSDCVDTSYKANEDFASASAISEVFNQYRSDTTQDGISIFPGEKKECQTENSCCKAPSGGPSIGDYVKAAKAVSDLYGYMFSGTLEATWFNYANAFTYVLSEGEAGTLSGLLGSSMSNFLGTNTLTIWGDLSALNMTTEEAAQAGINIIPSGSSFSASVSGSTLEAISVISTVATVITIALAVYSIVSVVYDLFYACDTEDIYTASRVKYRLCHYVGSHCTTKILFFCLKHHKVYCCFNSILARLIQEQGRVQLGIGWGSAGSPNCRGLTPGEISSLDFSKIDLREYLQYIEYTTEISSDKAEEIKNKILEKYTSGQ
jgi:hypothetical protein